MKEEMELKGCQEKMTFKSEEMNRLQKEKLISVTK
jgi:hypothetical protein